MTKQKLSGWLAGFAGIAAAIVAAQRGASHPAPPPAPEPPRYTLTVHVFNGAPARDDKIVGATVTLSDRAVATDGAGNVSIEDVRPGEYDACAAAVGFSRACATVRVPADGELNLSLTPDAPAVVHLGALSTDGPIFRQGGVPWRWKGVTAFQLLDRFAKGEDIRGFLDDFKGFNVLRVFLYTPRKDWGAAAWDPPADEAVLSFLRYVEQYGFYVELVLLTDDEPPRGPPAARLVNVLAAAKPSNLLVEIGNEPRTHKDINTGGLRAALDRSGFLYSSGDYEDSRRWFGRWLGAHTGRDGDWPRRAHDLFEYFHGGGPNLPDEPALKVPIVADEPIRPDQATGDRPSDFLAYFATSSLLGAGATYHYEGGKYGRRPDTFESIYAAIALEGLSAFPADAPKGAYRRPVEQSLRTYVVGNYMVRVRPTTATAPEPGWTPIDTGGLLWKR